MVEDGKLGPNAPAAKTGIIPVNRPDRSKKLRPDGTEYSKDPKERHQQLIADGKLGAKGSELARQQGRLGGRPRKPRAGQKIAEHASREVDRIISALDDALDSGNERIRMEAAREFVRIEREEAALQLDEDRFDQMSKDELVNAVSELLADSAMASVLDIEYIDSTAEEIH